MLICEGPFDVWRMGDGTTCTFGMELGQAQIKFIARKNIKRAFILFDEEDQSQIIAEKLGWMLSQFIPQIEIEVEISPNKKSGKNYLKIEFKDNGIGISNQIKNSLFKTIMRKEGKTEGMGLSLLLVKKILDSYNAEIWVEDRILGDPSKGSNFIIMIPEGS